MSQIVEELKHRNEWLENAVTSLTAGVVKPGVIAHTLERMLRNRPTNAVTYSDLDNAEYSDVSGVRQAENREWAKYRANIAALEAAIAKRREADKVRPILEAIGSISNKLDRLSDSVEREQERRKAGRPRKSDDFSDCFKSEDTEFNEELLEEMQMLAIGKIGKDFATLIQVAVNLDLIEKPTFKQCNDVFGYIGARTGYNRYMGLDLSKENESLYARIEKILRIL